MGKLICFGELMLRLNPEGYLRFLQAEKLEVSFAGGEANVAVDCACLGEAVSFVTKLPDQELGYSAANALRRYGVGVDQIVYGGPRLGIYFVEKGASQRASKVIYDRTDSSFALAKREDFDWEKLFEGASWFHFTGITPALSAEMPRICEDACRTAKAMGLTVSCDLNYRKKLWSREEAGRVMEKLMPYVDVCIANEEDAADVFGIRAADSDVQSGNLNREGYRNAAEILARRFSLSAVGVTLRKSISASRNLWSGMLYRDGNAYFSREYDIHIVDRVGGGDSFGAALIHAMKSGRSAQEVIDFAVAASCLKHTIEHDFNLVTEAEVTALMKGNGSGRVVR